MAAGPVANFLLAIVLFSAIFFLSFVYEVAKGGLEWGPLHRARRLVSGVPTDRTTESTIRRVGLEGRDEAADLARLRVSRNKALPFNAITKNNSQPPYIPYVPGTVAAAK